MEYKILYVHKLYLRTMLVHCTVYICNVFTIRMNNESTLNYHEILKNIVQRYSLKFRAQSCRFTFYKHWMNIIYTPFYN